VVVKETDLFIHADKFLQDITKELILKYRGYIEAYLDRYPDFLQTLKPWGAGRPMPAIINDMVVASEKAGVGPMAAVAGAIAEHVGADLLSYTDEIVVENGGDIFFKTNDPVTIGIFAGKSPLSLRLGIHLDSGGKSMSVCTSSSSIGHSLSLGKADAVCVVSTSCSLADAAATSIGNRVKSAAHIQTAIDFGKNIEGIRGIVIIINDEIGFWGDLEIVPLKGEKG
jgi:ApbE superfamily uncharacterized protein (UPF0280 family)